jgi:hypothetical protein
MVKIAFNCKIKDLVCMHDRGSHSIFEKTLILTISVTCKSVRLQSISKIQLYYMQNNSLLIRWGFRHNIVTFSIEGQLLC